MGILASFVVAAAALAGCGQSQDHGRKEALNEIPATATFDGADYVDRAGKVAHGKRLATLFGCNACHGTDYAGLNFGEMIPVLLATRFDSGQENDACLPPSPLIAL